ncbi:TolC family protein [Actinobacillus genomosp. 1]|uniref:TolC family protein n=1 Tax=Actinobacillus genomosp. 1 TaxID=254839 RepID=UPI002441361E|nr:TolC family protein [Actinobacillus genomosp. 1]WGE90886.1 TolC family protein [Actinobacillus genomosp. 1]
MKKLWYSLLTCLCFSSVSYAEKLDVILRHALVSDPSLDEARANLAAAHSQTKISEAGHYPVVSLSNTSMISQQHKYNSERRSGPVVNGKLNLYAWGAIEAEIERDEHKAGFYHHKLMETREVVGQKIAQLYLAALRAKENIVIYKESLARHNQLVKDLQVIVSYDEGREFEVNEAMSRKNQVESTIAEQERILYTSLSQLTRYFPRGMTEQSLTDPFPEKNVEAFLKKYLSKDISTNPTFLAQQKEFESSKAALKASEARRLPAINLEGSASRHEREIYVGVVWDIYNPAAKYTVEQNYHSQAAADAKLREIELDVVEKGRTAEVEMLRNKSLLTLAAKQIAAQRKVVKDTELQFEIATKSLLNLLDAYQELTQVQATEVAARNNYRDAALLYLVSQAKVAQWAGIPVLNLTDKK